MRRALEFAMIRPITPDDTAAPIALADAIGIFRPNELEEVGEVFAVAGAGSAGATGVAAGSVETSSHIRGLTT